jgi:hypothetical protein
LSSCSAIGSIDGGLAELAAGTYDLWRSANGAGSGVAKCKNGKRTPSGQLSRAGKAPADSAIPPTVLARIRVALAFDLDLERLARVDGGVAAG